MFANTSTSILNIYEKCYFQNLTQGKHISLSQSGKTSGLGGELDCDDSLGAFEFFNDENIRIHLHVDRFGFIKRWYPCSQEVEDKYVMNKNASYHLYPILMKAGYRIWVYSGDVDADVPITGTINWL